ncbi:MAG: Do family serine endopeptidase [Massilibacteroides sp.]|nr:Do family serine endopeptidase [Massilibacteroides sp.]
MKILFKNVVKVVLVAAISAGAAIGTTKYLMSKKQPVVVSEQGFNKPLHYASINSVAAENTDFTEAAASSVHAVVHITSTKNADTQSQRSQAMDPFDFFFGNGNRSFQRPSPQPSVAVGSGVIISTDGYIITNNHVVESADKLSVKLNDNRKFEAKLIGRDPMTDIALIKIEAENLPVIPFGDSDKLKVGEWVLAVGNPFNLNSTVTAGIVSAKNRGISMGQRKIESFIQTDAAVNPGNSGGALVNTKGELIGINTAIYSQTGNYAGYSFAVPISIASKVVGDLKEYGTVQRAVLGVSIIDADIIANGNVKEIDKDLIKNIKVYKGAFVADFADRSVAKEAGIEKGDVIVGVNSDQVSSANSLQEQISKYRPGDKVTIKVNRGGETKTFEIELHNMQGSTTIVENGDGNELLGAAIENLTKDEMRTYGVNYGVKVTGLTKGKFLSAGMKKGFVIMIINNTKITSTSQIEKMTDQILNGQTEDRVLFIKGFYPNGRTKYFAIDLSE